MFNLLKSELKYYKVILTILSTLLVTLHTVFLINGTDNLGNSVPALRVVILAFTLILFVYRTITLIKDGRDKIFVGLPLEPKSIGLARLSFLPVFWLFAVSLFLLSNLIAQFSNIEFYFVAEIISLTGLIILLNALVMIYIDFINFGLDRKKTLIIQISGIFLAAFSYFLFIILMPIAESIELTTLQNFRVNISNIYRSFFGAIFMLLLGSVFTIISINIFSKRKSYLTQ